MAGYYHFRYLFIVCLFSKGNILGTKISMVITIIIEHCRPRSDGAECKFFPFRVNPFSEGTWCAGKHWLEATYLAKKMELYHVCQVPLRWIFFNVHFSMMAISNVKTDRHWSIAWCRPSLTFSNYISSEIAWPIQTKLHCGTSMGWANKSLFIRSSSHDQNGHHIW